MITIYNVIREKHKQRPENKKQLFLGDSNKVIINFVKKLIENLSFYTREICKPQESRN